jgi:hypothetical protein
LLLTCYQSGGACQDFVSFVVSTEGAYEDLHWQISSAPSDEWVLSDFGSGQLSCHSGR